MEKYREWVKIQHTCKNLGVNKCCYFFMWNPEAVAQRCSVKNVFLEISQNSQEYTCARVSFLIKLQDWGLCFPVNFAKFLRTPFLKEHLWWLLLWNLWTTLLKMSYTGTTVKWHHELCLSYCTQMKFSLKV